MIVAVKRTNYKRIFIKILSLLAVVGMFTAYYFHMGEEFKEIEKEVIVKKEKKKTTSKELKRALYLEKIIYKEASKAVDLLRQTKVRDIRVYKNKLLIICDPDTIIEPLMVRYGVLALIKNSSKDIKIAIDLKYIVESNYDEKKI